MNGDAVVIDDLVKRFGDFVAVDHVSLRVAKGEIFGFLGPNGAGKSTTIRMLCGLLGPTSGRGTVGGFDIATESEQVRRTIGYMSQKFSLYDDLTVEENIRFFAGIYGVAEKRVGERMEYVLEMAGLKERKSTLTRQLSGGWKQRLALGCAILHEPPILFLDEPTSGVDPLARRAFWDLIYSLSAAGHTIFVSTHYMDEAEYCHRVALMYRGRMIALGSPEELKHSLDGTALLAVESEDVFESLRALEGVEGIRDVAVFGAGLHVTADDAERGMAAVRAAHERGGVGVTRVERIVPSMEDVFVALIEAEDRKTDERGPEGAPGASPDNRFLTVAARKGSQTRASAGGTGGGASRTRGGASGTGGAGGGAGQDTRAAYTRARTRTYAVARKEWLHIIRDARSLTMALALPVLLLLLFGTALSLDVDRVRTVIHDADKTSASRDLIERFRGSRYFEVQGEVESAKEVARLIDRNAVLIGVSIPRGYGRDIASKTQAKVQFLVDGSDSNTASIALGYAEALVRAYALELRGVAGPPVDSRLQVWYNSELQSKNYVVPGLIAVVLMIIAALLTSQTIAREWETGTMEQLLSTPVRSAELVIGKMAAYFVLGIVDAVVAIAVGVGVFGVPFRGNALFLGAACCVFLVGALFWGILLSAIARTQLMAFQLGLISSFLPSFLLSGFVYAIETMPVFFQVVTNVIPTRHFVTILKAVFLKGAGLVDLWQECLFLCLFAIIVFTAATRKLTGRIA